ncbi:MAG: hypothetical protein EXS46_01305 [Candidatus Taylorbacteria bacterium]|nr:hypothetical protein [Candidatus Taylorbacteria bacterium]
MAENLDGNNREAAYLEAVGSEDFDKFSAFLATLPDDASRIKVVGDAIIRMDKKAVKPLNPFLTPHEASRRNEGAFVVRLDQLERDLKYGPK